MPHESSGVMDTNFPTNVVKMKFDMYPNPACGYQIQQARIKIYLDSYEIKLPLFVRVFDVLGREISCRQLSEINNNSSFELFRESEFHNQKPMASGIYFVQVAANSTIEYRKLVVLQ